MVMNNERCESKNYGLIVEIELGTTMRVRERLCTMRERVAVARTMGREEMREGSRGKEIENES